MPGMDGIEATDKIRKQGYIELPIIALTANAVAGAMEMFLAKGFSDFLPKPIIIHELSIVLKKYLPPEKITGRVEALSSMAEAESRSAFICNLDRIGAINTSIGLSHSAGMESLYRDALEVFYVRLMQECFTLSAYLAVEDAHGFSIAILAMKSMLANIGAMRLAESAAAMEIAATHEDLEFCLDKFPAFKDAITSLHEQLSVVFHAENQPFTYA
jgi:CheY-like chemotaxis protein